MRYMMLVLALVGVVGCSGSSVDEADGAVAEVSVGDAGDVVAEVVLQPFDVVSDAGLDLEPAELPQVEVGEDATGPLCESGEGCFLDNCDDNSDCLSGWCVEHLGEAVCSQGCVDECPAGWSCQMVAGTRPDAVFICVSDVTNLCRPCNAAGDCKTGYGAEDVCVDYGAEGAFCGASCVEDGQCPWGFSCLTTVTVDGISTLQCVADAGVCPCTAKSTALSLWTACDVSNELGMCAGKRVCGEDGLTDCDAATPADETCNGVDDDCDGEVDEATQVDEGYVGLCSDDNPCTTDSCNGEDGCESVALTEGECMDGDPCTVADHCESGVCVGAAVECDDSNPCTEDLCTATGGCEHPAQAGECDDGEPCTLGDHCVTGECGGEAVACDCLEDEDCLQLEDGDQCNGTLVCDISSVPFECVLDVNTVVACPAPEGLGASCLEVDCDPLTGACGFAPAHDAAPCDDGDACTVGETCDGGSCVGGVEANCNDGNVCTDDSCDPQEGCLLAHNDSACSDGLDCTVGDGCQGGLCVGGAAAACDDGNLCTDDSCAEGVGCLHAANAAACDDGNACTVGDHCEGGVCKVDGGADCDDGNPCTDDTCLADEGCTHAVNEVPCDDGDPCTVGEQCAGGVCSGGVPQNCDDGNVCTDDFCGEDGLCVHANNDAACDDGNACTVSEQCSGGACVVEGTLDCDDGNICTTDSCDADSGCAYVLNTAPCDDGDLCTTTDACSLGECLGSVELICVDGNPCTDDGCEAESGCWYEFNALPCDDGDACTENEECGTGVCGGGELVLCDDGNICTDDSCLAETGCQYLPNEIDCDDGSLCTMNDKCAASACVPGEPLPCDDGKECTQNGCEALSGCTYQDEPNGTACGEGQAGECQEGVCEFTAVAYANGNEAYWTERKLGYRDVTIGGGNTLYTYDESLKQYRNGNTILVPTKAGGANGLTMSATNFYGFQGGSASDANFQWDSESKLQQPNDFDVPKMFISPMLMEAMSYCQIMQNNNSGCSSTTVDGPNDTLAYPNHSPKSGTYNVESGTDLIAVANLKGNGSPQYISQQQLGAGVNASYCVVTYGQGWRMATDVEMGHTTDEMDQFAEIGYRGTSSYRVRSSTAWPGLNDQRWCPYSNTGSFNQCNVSASGSRRVRCVFPGK